MRKPQILVTNDDGIQAPELAILVRALDPVGEVWVYAPDRQQSAVGHGVSLHRPLRVTQVKDHWYMVDGTPTDCAMLAVRDLLETRPDIVVSGINPGANLGDDVTYSGTVAGAYEGMLLGLPSFAISVASYNASHFEPAGEYAARLAGHVIRHGLPPNTMLNVNVPDVAREEVRGVAVTRMGRRNYQDVIVRRVDPRGNVYYWIGGSEPAHVAEAGTDFEAIENNMISVTPLHRDVTNYAAIPLLQNAGLESGEPIFSDVK
jgi:5'-nucleotidase